eukprot:494213-Pleurochrysis_carterae.AAC.1
MTAETGVCGTKIVTKPMITYRVLLAKNFGTGHYTSLPPQWGRSGKPLHGDAGSELRSRR